MSSKLEIMKKLFIPLFSLGLMFSISSCDSKIEKKTDTEEVAEEKKEEPVSKEEEKQFGNKIGQEGAVSVEQFAEMMAGADTDTLRVKIAAVAEDVCKNKGCWMKVKTADGDQMRIRFKDYGFFVPMDITGKNVVFEGIAFRDTVSVEDLRHYAKDGGQSDEEIAAITEPEIKTSFLADGVLITD